MAGNSKAIRAGNAFVEFTLKDGKLRKGLRSMEKRFNAIGGTLKRLGAIGSAVAGAITGAFTTAAVVFANAGSKLFDMSQRTGVSVEALSELSFAADQTGGSMEALEKGFAGLSRTFFQAKRGAAAPVAALKEIGLTVADLEGLSPDQQLGLIADGLTAISDASIRGAVAQQLFGRSGRQLLPILIGAKGGLEALRAEAQRLGLVMSSDDAAAADALGDAMDTLWAQVNRVTQVVGAAVAGSFTRMLQASQAIFKTVIDWANANPELIRTVFTVGVVLAAVSGAIIAAGIGFQVLGFMAGTLSTALGAVGAVLSFVVSPLGLIIAGVAGSVAAFATLTESGRGMAASLGTYFGELGTIVTQTFSAIGAALAAGDIEAAGKVLWAALNLLWLQGTAGLRETWHSFTGAIAKAWHSAWSVMQMVGAQIVGNIERGWSHTSEFFTTLWDTTVQTLANTWDGLGAAMMKAWNHVAAFIERIWARIKGVVTGNAAEEIERINAELEAANSKIDQRVATNQQQRAANVANRAAERNATAALDRENSLAAQHGQVDAIVADLERKLAGADDGTKAAIAAAQAELEKSRAAFRDARMAAEAAGAAAAAEKVKPATEGAAAASSMTPGKFTTTGSFNALAAMLTGQGGNIDDKILETNREQLTVLKDIKRQKSGGLVAGA